MTGTTGLPATRSPLSVAAPPGDFLSQVTPVVLTFNEAPNIGRALDRLKCFREVVIVDSGSTDGTLTIVSEFPNARVVTRPFDSFAGQWNFAIRESGISTEWVLAMDADYVLTDSVIEELSRMAPDRSVAGYRVSFAYCVEGRQLSGTLYPPVVALFRHRSVHFVQDGHCMRAQVQGQVGALVARVLHDDRKSLSRWLSSQARYAEEECQLLLSRSSRELGLADRLRRLIVIMPWLVPIYCLTAGRGALDGRAGLHYALQRGVAEAILAIRLIEAQLRSARGHGR